MKKIFKNRRLFTSGWIPAIAYVVTFCTLLMVIFSIIIFLAGLGIIK